MNGPSCDPGTNMKADNMKAAAEFDSLPPNSDEAGPSSYRDLTKEEILERIARGYKQALAGEYRPIQELLDELDD